MRGAGDPRDWKRRKGDGGRVSADRVQRRTEIMGAAEWRGSCAVWGSMTRTYVAVIVQQAEGALPLDRG